MATSSWCSFRIPISTVPPADRAKTRPAIVVQADDLGADLTQVIVAMIRGRMFHAGHPSRVVVRHDTAEGRSAGLLGDSVVMTDKLATVAEAAIDRVIGKLG